MLAEEYGKDAFLELLIAGYADHLVFKIPGIKADQAERASEQARHSFLCIGHDESRKLAQDTFVVGDGLHDLAVCAPARGEICTKQSADRRAKLSERYKIFR